MNRYNSYSFRIFTQAVFVLILLLFTGITVYSQEIKPPLFFKPELNRLFNETALYPFFDKLAALEKNKKGQIKIVHIGDSHLQAGDLAGEIRAAFQNRFGDAGRGLIFPYKLAQSNSPHDISGSSNSTWQYNRIAHPEIAIEPGVSGFCITKDNPFGTISMKTLETDFTHLDFFFLRNKYAKNALVSIPASAQRYSLDIHTDTLSLAPLSIQLEAPANEFTITFLPWDAGTSNISFYGVSATNDSAGVIYHSIGVNGAKYVQYAQSRYFFNQLKYLDADLYIVSLGTNEAQNPALTPEELEGQINQFYEAVHAISPNATLLITTPASSFFRNSSINYKIVTVRDTEIEYARKKNLPYWDLFLLSGANSAKSWRGTGLLAQDGVHYTAPAYKLQGQLLAKALLDAYDKHVHLDKTPVK